MTDRPLGVRLLIWLFWFWAGALVLLALGLAVGDGPVMMSGRAVPRPDALMRMLPVLLPMALAVVGAAVALGLGLGWARPTALLPFLLAAFGPLLTGVGGASAMEVVVAALVLAPVVVLLVWYLYFQPGPRGFFGTDRTVDPADLAP